MQRFLTLSVLALAVLWAARADGQTQTKTPNDPVASWDEMLEDFLMWDVFDIPMWRVLAALAVIVAGLALKNGLFNRLLRPLERWLNTTETTLDNKLLAAIRIPGGWFIFVWALWVALRLLQLPATLDDLLTVVLTSSGTAVIAWMLFRAVEVAGLALHKFVDDTDSDIDDHIIPLLVRVLRIGLVSLAVIMIIQQWGYDVTGLIAGVGIGGIALALAAQDTLSNWFGSLMIFTDRPFRIGDWVKAGSIEGIVEEVGLRSTKIRTFDETLITVPNKTIANENCENFSMRDMRRIDTTIGLTYGTTHAQIEAILADIRAALAAHPLAMPETILVHFSAFGGSSLDVMIRVFFKTNSIAVFAPARQEVFLEIMRIVEEHGSGFAFPSQSIYFENELPPTSAV